MLNSPKKILLGITGGIAAYKSADLVRRLRENGAEVRVVMTRTAQQFITPLTFHALSSYPVVTDDEKTQSEFAMDHIALARWADVILIAPATADFMAKLACGLADNILSTLCLASEVPIVIAPAMNQAMWKNSATQCNKNILLQRGVYFLDPAVGDQACGEKGAGRMQESLEILSGLAAIFKNKNALQKMRFLITAGPTHEAIDPVRYLTNRSSGKMGYALAQAAASQGAHVTLISGTTVLDCPKDVTRVSVTTAQEMYQAVMENISQSDIFISTAAVADYRCDAISPQKIKKNGEPIQLSLVPNPDILRAVTSLKKPPFTVGFAAETENLRKNALQKLTVKKLDMMVANDVSNTDSGFDVDQNSLLVLWKDGEKVLPVQPKIQLAEKLLTLITRYYYRVNSSEVYK